MEGFYRIAAATPRLHLGDPAANAKALVRLAKDTAKDGVSAIVFAELCLTGYTCGDMFFRDELLDAANAAAVCYMRSLPIGFPYCITQLLPITLLPCGGI